jgi:hypothetical protein
MSVREQRPVERLQLPQSLRTQLDEFRQRVWTIKLIEAAFAAAFGVVVAYLAMFVLDRLWETPAVVRLGLFAVVLGACSCVPMALNRWVWGHRRLDQLARLLTRTHPRVGDQLLGVIELVDNDLEQARSRALCEAAVTQVAEDAAKRDFRDAVPNPRHRLWAGLAAGPIALTLGLLAVYPAAASNAWARLLAPWKTVSRYNFAAINPLPDRLVVAHGEPFSVSTELQGKALWHPSQGTVQLDGQPPVVARLSDGRYEFSLPPQIEPAWLSLKIGDARQHILVEPTLRPELTSVIADVSLPAYLGLPKAQRKDVRGGSVSLVNGSSARVAVTASRDLAKAQVDGQPSPPEGATVVSPAATVTGTRMLEFRWQDLLGLSGKEPFQLSINGKEDEPPSLACEELPRLKVVLDSEQLDFKVRAQDDFGVKTIGLEWRGAEDATVKTPAKGERVLAAGGNDKDTLEVGGTFSAKTLGIEPQQIQVRVFAEDYLPGRPRVYSPTYTFYVLNPEQHAIWLTEQLSKWHRQSLEVRDRELQLHETNKQLRAMSAEQLDTPDARRRIENQSAAERGNGRRLSALVVNGEDLVRQAMRNPEFGVGHLEKWAEMLQILKDISGSRMPSVADLLKQAAQAPTVASAPPTGDRIKTAGQTHPATGSPTPPSNVQGKRPPVSVTQIGDGESSQNSPAKPPDGKQDDSPTKPKSPRQGLVVTAVPSKPGKNPSAPPPTPAQENVDQAVQKQQDLLAEFDKIAEELNKVLANLEGSTLVKRLKAASRLQDKIAGRVGDQLAEAFGQDEHKVGDNPGKVLVELSSQEAKQSQVLSVVMDDIQSYFERRQYMRFKTVLDEMKQQDVIGGLRSLGDDLKKENGVSIALCEFWSDTFDRWAEDLVDPANSGKCPGSRSRGSLPPSIVLEVLKILEAEVNLREETRVVEQSKAAIIADDHKRQAGALSETQYGLKDRVEKVSVRIRDLPDGDQEFAYELRLLGKVADVMGEATEILAKPETGRPAIAAETEAIELLLQSKRINPKGGGGGGSSPGGGGTGTTNDSALALLGGGVNDKENREDHGISQSVGEAGPTLPEEFRAGLDQYFNRLDRRPGGQ